jgi:hypothetical protein
MVRPSRAKYYWHMQGIYIGIYFNYTVQNRTPFNARSPSGEPPTHRTPYGRKQPTFRDFSATTQNTVPINILQL